MTPKEEKDIICSSPRQKNVKGYTITAEFNASGRNDKGQIPPTGSTTYTFRQSDGVSELHKEG